METDPRLLPIANYSDIVVGSRWISAVRAIRWRGRKFTVVRSTKHYFAIRFDGSKSTCLIGNMDYFLSRYRLLPASDLPPGS